mmetsp:Transcript_24326/g.57638  ORF Transcript_24326/g.57638 Transcript_24326/m.57638 type:complete len:141 (-) Transcript_24326:1012-1434(-)
MYLHHHRQLRQCQNQQQQQQQANYTHAQHNTHTYISHHYHHHHHLSTEDLELFFLPYLLVFIHFDHTQNETNQLEHLLFHNMRRMTEQNDQQLRRFFFCLRGTLFPLYWSEPKFYPSIYPSITRVYSSPTIQFKTKKRTI